MASDAPPRERPPPASACASSSRAPAGTRCRSWQLTWDAVLAAARTWARMKDRLEQLKAVSLQNLGIWRAGGCRDQPSGGVVWERGFPQLP